MKLETSAPIKFLLVGLCCLPFLLDCSSAHVTNLSAQTETGNAQYFVYSKMDLLTVSAISDSLGEIKSGPLSMRDRRNRLFVKNVVTILETGHKFKSVSSQEQQKSESQKDSLGNRFSLNIKIEELPSDRTDSFSNSAAYVATLGVSSLKKYKKYRCILNISDSKSSKQIELNRTFDLEFETQETLPGQHGDDLGFYVSTYGKMWLPLFETAMRYQE